MAPEEGNAIRERTRREAIDAMLLNVASWARENDQAALRLRGILVGAPPEEQRPERPSRPGWLREITDALEVMLEHLDDAAKVLEEVSQQVAVQTPTAMAPRREPMPKVTAFLDCGCAILEDGSRTWCPSCEAEPAVEAYVIRVPGDGSEHLEYIRENWEHIPDFMWHSVAQVMEMAEKWIKGLK